MMIAQRLVFVSFCLSLLVACSGRNIHPELREDRSVLERLWTLEPQWNIPGEMSVLEQGTEYSNAVMHENTLIYGLRKAGLIALYPTLNQTRWALPIPGGVESEISVDRGVVYCTGGDGFLYAVQADTGRVSWKYEVRNPLMSRPTVSGGRVFVTGSDDVVHALDAGTGKWLWHYRRRTGSQATIHAASQPLVDGNEVLVGMSDGYLVALSLQDGSLKWERRLHMGNKFTDVDAHPVLDAGVVYIPSYDGALYALKRQGGEILWRFDAGGSRSVEVDGDRLYLPSSDGMIHALQKSNAKELWKFELDHGTPTRLVITDQHVIVGSSFQYLYVLDKNTGKGLYRLNIGYGSGFHGSPAWDSQGRRMYFLSGTGNLYAFKLPTLQRSVTVAPAGSSSSR